MSADMVALLTERADGSDASLLALETGNPQECVRSVLRRACAEACVKRFTPHGLRRMVVDQMIQLASLVSLRSRASTSRPPRA